MSEHLEHRLQQVEDRLAILNLLASYGPGVDSQDSDAVGALFTTDGSYETDPVPLHGRRAIEQMVGNDPHASFVARGCAHVLGTPTIVLDGDHATAVFHSLLVAQVETTDGFEILRASANRCELRRTGDGWRIARRVNRVLDGSEAARALFRDRAAGER